MTFKFLHDRLNDELDVVAEPVQAGVHVRMFRGRGATARQPPRVEEIIEHSGNKIVGRAQHPNGDVTYWLDGMQ